MLTGNTFFSRNQSSLRISRKWGRYYVSQWSRRTSRAFCRCERKGGGRDELLLMRDEHFY